MVPSKYYLFVNFILLYLFFLKYISISAGENCSSPTFKKDEKLVIEYFFNSEVSTFALSPEICPIVHASKGQFRMIYHACSGSIDKAKCTQNYLCTRNRMHACYLKYFAKEYNSCPDELPSIDLNFSDCVCTGASDDILTSNEALRIKYGVQKVPALVLNGKYDPCLKDLSAAGLKSYFCKAYNNEIPLCKSGK